MSSLAIPLSSRIPTKGEPAKIRWYPGENSWGKNPHGKPLYRVIWSESRTYILGGCWPDGAIEYRHSPYYGTRQEWVLEKWLTAKEYAGSEDEWNLSQIDENLARHGMAVYAMGPYPANGWYEHCYSFPVDGVNLHAIVPLLEQTQHLTHAQIRAGIQLHHERMRKEWERKVEDGIRDSAPAFGNVATNLGNTRPTGDTALSSPEDLRATVARYKGEKTKKQPDFEELPRRGVSMPQRKES